MLTLASEVEVLARFGRALADPIRCRLLLALREAPAHPSDLAETLGISRTRLSNHLACLRWCGFVTTRREHRTIHYRLADDRVSAVVELGRALLHDNAEHIAACQRVDGAGC